MDKKSIPFSHTSTIKRTRPRKSRDRRLLEALVDKTWQDANGDVNFPLKVTGLLADKLIAIKQAMKKKGGGQ